MQERFAIEELASMRGKPVYSQDGDKVGSIDRVFYDTDSGRPEWIGVDKGGLFGIGSKTILVPLEGAHKDAEGDGLRVPYVRDTLKDAPEIDGDEISESYEQEVYAYYGLPPAGYRAETQLPQERPDVTPPPADRPATAEDTMSRYEEELHVGKRDVPRTARLRKWVETEPVSEEANLRRETAHVEREAVNRPAPGAQIGEEEVETTLHEEEPVVQKETMERERVRLEREEHEEQETVEGEVRRERIEAEGDLEDEDRGDELSRAG